MRSNVPSPEAYRGFGWKGALFCVLCATPVFLTISHLGNFGRARAAALCVAIDVAVVKLYNSPERGLLSSEQLWFWYAILFATAVQTAVVFGLSWQDESLPAYSLMPAAIVIYLLDLGIVRLFGEIGYRLRPK